MFDILMALPPKVYNFLLALLMSSLSIYLFIHSSDIARDNALDEMMVQQAIISGAAVIFLFFSRFQSVVGKFLKALAYLIVGGFVVYMTADMQDKSLMVILRGVAGLMVAFGLYGFVSFAYFKNRDDELKKNGWKLEAKWSDVNLDADEDMSFYVIKFSARHPQTGETLYFKSERLNFNPSDKLEDGQVFTVYVDRNNPKKYCFDEDAFSNLRAC